MKLHLSKEDTLDLKCSLTVTPENCETLMEQKKTSFSMF